MVAGVANAAKQYRKLQIGKETTYGIEVAATRMLRILGRTSMPSDVGSIVRTGLLGRVETDFSFEDVLFALLAGFKGGVTAGAELTASPSDRPWTFQLYPHTGDPTPG